MKLSKLIDHVGDENILLQNIMHSSPSISKGKRDGRITFSTDSGKANDLMGQVMCQTGKWTALVVWIPNEKLPNLKEQNASINKADSSDWCAEQRVAEAGKDSTAKDANERENE